MEITKLSDEDFLLQKDLQELIGSNFKSENWTIVYDKLKNERMNIGFFSAFIPNDLVSSALQDANWDISIGAGGPEVCISYKNGSEVREYSYYAEKRQIQPIVLVRDFHSIRPSYIEIQEEFRLFHNLYYDSIEAKYIKIQNDGNEEDIIIIEGEAVRIKTRALREYAAIKDASIMLYIDSVRYSPILIDQISELKRHQEYRDDKMAYELHVKDNILSNPDERTFSLFIGKRIIRAFSKEKAGIWPYEDESEQYESFIVGLNDDDDTITHSCDPKELENPVGANPDAPDYLTPIFFRREVLNKYYAQPQKYKVDDGHLWCGSLWALRMDNNHPKYVIVWLGDLGTDLPYCEQTYWKAFNVPADGSISKTCYTRHILGEFADPESPDLKFKIELSQFKENWNKIHGWPLLLELSHEDQHLLTALHLPTTGDQAEFDNQVLALTKILVDSLNEAELEKHISSVPKGGKGIGKLEGFLQENNNHKVNFIVSFLRNLQALRSTGVGHRKGDNYEKVARRFGICAKNLQQVFGEILTDAIATLIALSNG
jgi:hypothetical protein